MISHDTSSFGSVHTLSGAYAADALNGEERLVFEEHLPGCFDCRAEVAGLREATAILAAAVAMTPPPSLRTGVLTGVRSIRPLPPEVDHSASDPVVEPAEPVEKVAEVVPLRRRFRLGALAAAAAVLAVIGVGGVVADTLRGPDTTQISAADRVLTASDVRNVHVTLAGGASATVARSVDMGKAVIVSEGMQRLPKDKVYELWLRNPEGVMVPAGLLEGRGDHKQVLAGDAASATGAAISVEPSGGSSSPTTEPVALFDFQEA